MSELYEWPDPRGWRIVRTANGCLLLLLMLLLTILTKQQPAGTERELKSKAKSRKGNPHPEMKLVSEQFGGRGVATFGASNNGDE